MTILFGSVMFLEGSNLILKSFHVFLAILPGVKTLVLVVGGGSVRSVLGPVEDRSVLLGLDSSGDSSNGCNDKSGAHDL